MLPVFDEILDVLSDGHYHTFIEILTGVLEKTTINENQLDLALSFLEETGFVKRVRAKWSTRTLRAALSPRAVQFLERLKELEDTDEKETRAALAKEGEL